MKKINSGVIFSLMPIRMGIVFCCTALLLLSSDSFAASTAVSGAMAKVMCNVLAMILIDIGRAIATASVVMLGAAATLGKASLGQLVAILVGIGIVFGAPFLAMTLTVGKDAFSNPSAILPLCLMPATAR